MLWNIVFFFTIFSDCRPPPTTWSTTRISSTRMVYKQQSLAWSSRCSGPTCSGPPWSWTSGAPQACQPGWPTLTILTRYWSIFIRWVTNPDHPYEILEHIHQEVARIKSAGSLIPAGNPVFFKSVFPSNVVKYYFVFDRCFTKGCCSKGHSSIITSLASCIVMCWYCRKKSFF